MSSLSSLRYVMDTWGLEFRPLNDDVTTWIVADSLMHNLKRTLGDKGSVLEVACSEALQPGVFQIYVYFNWPPDTKDAVVALNRSIACMDPLSCYLKSPFTKEEDRFDDISSAIARLKSNIKRIRQDVTSGSKFCLITNPDFKTDRNMFDL